MAFWDTVKMDLKKAMEEGWTVVKDGAKIAAEKSEEVARSGKLKYRAHLLHKDAEKLFADLGGLVYDLANGTSRKALLLNPEVKRIIEEIRQLENNASVMEDDITNIKLHKVKSTLEVTTKPVGSKAAPKKTAKPAVKKAVKKKVIKKKTAAKTTAPKKTIKKKTVAKKAAVKKPSAKKAAPKKSPKKTTSKKAAPKKG
jgi:hypothetical protein